MRALLMLRASLLGMLMAIAGAVAASTTAYAQDDYDRYIELLRADIRAEKVAVLTETLQLSDEQASVFWPIQREYEKDLGELNDKRLVLIKEYIANYEYSMTLARVKELAEGALKLEEDRVKLRKKYFDKIQKELNPMVAAKFIWTERLMNSLGDVQVMTELPFLK